MRALAILLAVTLLGGCALFTRDASRALAEADARIVQGDYPAAMAAYDAYLVRYADDGGAPHARAMRKLLVDVIAARTELASLQERTQGREAEVTRLRAEIAARQAELARLKQDIEELKRTDLQMERRRR